MDILILSIWGIIGLVVLLFGLQSEKDETGTITLAGGYLVVSVIIVPVTWPIFLGYMFLDIKMIQRFFCVIKTAICKSRKWPWQAGGK